VDGGVVLAMWLAVSGQQTVDGLVVPVAGERPPALSQRNLGRAHPPIVGGRDRRRMWSYVQMAVLIDEPLWWHRGRRWSHLVSDTSLDELHAFADLVELPRRGFQGDHYDVPEEYYDELVAAGAMPTASRDLLRRLKQAGLRLTPEQRRERRAAPNPEAARGDG
jgi:Protein of unknown function (DUF4031)